VNQLPSQADFSVFSRVVGGLAGAGGIEPPNGGIKISLIIQRLQGAFGKMAKTLSSSLLKNLEMESFLILAGRCWSGAVELDVIYSLVLGVP